MYENSSLIIEALKHSATALEKQDQQSAIDSLGKITHEANTFKKVAESSENETKQLQAATVTQVSELIMKQGKAHADLEQTKKELDAAYTEIAAKKVSIQNLMLRIEGSTRELNDNYKQFADCKARISDLNDRSALSILKSIGTLGFDRLGKWISIEMDGVRNKIDNARATIDAYTGQLSVLRSELDQDNIRVDNLNVYVVQKNKLIKDLDFLEFKLKNQEEIQRKRLVFFTEINLFYIKLQNLLNDLSHKIEDVRDIVNELDKQTPTITSFDPSRQNLISLKQAIVLFEENLKKGVSVSSLDPVFDESCWYDLTTEWLGTKRSLTIDRNGESSKLMMAVSDGNSGQLWNIKSCGNGYFKLNTKLFADKKSLDITSSNGIDFTPAISDTGNGPGQLWKIEPEFGYFRLTTKWQGENKSLDIINDGENNKLTIADSGNYSGQHWRFVPSATSMPPTEYRSK